MKHSLKISYIKEPGYDHGPRRQRGGAFGEGGRDDEWAFPQKHGLAVGKSKQVGEHPIPGSIAQDCAMRVLLTDVAVDQQPDFLRQFHLFQPAGVFVRFAMQTQRGLPL